MKEKLAVELRLDSALNANISIQAQADARVDSASKILKTLEAQRDTMSITWGTEYKALKIKTLKSSPVSILSDKYHYEEELPANHASKTWFGLYEEDGKFVIKKERPYLDADYPVRKSSKSIVHISGIKDMEAGEVQTADLDFKPYFPGEYATADLGGHQYYLMAVGEVDTRNNLSSNPRIKNYALRLFAHPFGKRGNSQVLALKHYIDSNPFALVWAGDLDGDNKMDFLIDASYHYNHIMNLQLFLSSYAEEGEWVKRVATFTSTGC